MQHHVGEMMSGLRASGPGAENLSIEHVKDRGNRMPIVCVHMSKGPDNAIKRKAVGNPWVVEDILPIVVIHELVAAGLAKDDENHHRQDDTDNGDNTSITDGSG